MLSGPRPKLPRSSCSSAAASIVGILKTIHDGMTASLGDATSAETGAIQNDETLRAAMTKEFATLQKQIEEEMTRIGVLSVKLQENRTIRRIPADLCQKTRVQDGS